MTRTIYCLFSGGRDSAIACAIAKRVADARGWNFVLVHIDTGTALPGVKEYVVEYARWLGIKYYAYYVMDELIALNCGGDGGRVLMLVIVRTDFEYWEGVEEWGYPLYWDRRWCKTYLKDRPLFTFLGTMYRPGDIVVMGIRKTESLYREREFNRTFYKYRHRSGMWVSYWLPLLHADDVVVSKLARRLGIPTSPVWRIGFSGECMCMAGMSKSKLDRVIDEYPEYAEEIARRDEEVQRKRRSGPAYPAPLVKVRVTLHDYVRDRKKRREGQTSIMDFIEYTGSSCAGTCMLPIGRARPWRP